MSPDPKPFDPLTDDLPPPNMVAFDVDVLKERLGNEVAENILLRSQLANALGWGQQQQQQIAVLKARVAELTPKEAEPAASHAGHVDCPVGVSVQSHEDHMTVTYCDGTTINKPYTDLGVASGTLQIGGDWGESETDEPISITRPLGYVSPYAQNGAGA